LLWPRSTADAELASVQERYLNRIKHFFPIEVVEIAPQKGGQSAKDAAIIRARDSARLLAAIPQQATSASTTPFARAPTSCSASRR
jgi:23S rRNA pseudoU1915 N3-methylase RlmH